MDVQRNQLFFPTTFQELFSEWTGCPDGIPFAGGTQLLRFQGKWAPNIPRNIFCLDKLEELHRITRTERYLEIGAMVKLNEIIGLGKIVPEVFTRCLEGIGGLQIRNLATIGGNICNGSRRSDASAPMIALDAHYELRTAAAARWISASRFSGHPGPLPINPQELLTRIRIPLDPWDYSLYKKFKPSSSEEGGVMVFIIRNQKNILTNIRLVFAGALVLQDRNTETLLIGKRLPLDRKNARNFVEHWESYLSSLTTPLDGFLQDNIVNFIETGLLSLSD